MTLSVREANPFKGSILAEKIIATNEHFRIVEDKEPAVPGHLLLFPFEEVPSLAETDTELLGDFLEGQFANMCSNRNYFFVERGRGRFCSSLGNVFHAHAHLVPEESCRRIILKAETARTVPHLRDAFHMVKGIGEYLLAGRIGGPFQVIYPLSNAPKRLARMILTGDSAW
ncbi:MAG: HIT domain-containing protein [Pyrinomonadaceae bacterium]